MNFSNPPTSLDFARFFAAKLEIDDRGNQPSSPSYAPTSPGYTVFEFPDFELFSSDEDSEDEEKRALLCFPTTLGRLNYNHLEVQAGEIYRQWDIKRFYVWAKKDYHFVLTKEKAYIRPSSGRVEVMPKDEPEPCVKVLSDRARRKYKSRTLDMQWLTVQHQTLSTLGVEVRKPLPDNWMDNKKQKVGATCKKKRRFKCETTLTKEQTKRGIESKWSLMDALQKKKKFDRK